MRQQPHLLHIFSTFAAGGPQVRTADLFAAFADRYRHTVVAMDRNYDCAARIAKELPVRYQEPPALRSSLSAPLGLRAMIREVAPDLVLTYNWGAIENIPAARLAGIRRLIHAEDGFGPDEVQQLKRRRVLARRLVLPWTRSVVVPSQLLLRILTGIWKHPPARSFYVPNGIDTEHFSPGTATEFRARLGIPAQGWVVGTVARLRAEKGLDLLVEAFCRALGQEPDNYLLIVGEGPERVRLQQLAQKLGAERSVIFAGNVEDPRDAYRAMNLFALSSHTEQMPISVVEAMATSLAVLATDVGDVKDMLPQSQGATILRNRDVAEYAEALQRLRDVTLESSPGAQNRQRCLRDFSRASMVERYAQLYEGVLSGTLPRPFFGPAQEQAIPRTP